MVQRLITLPLRVAVTMVGADEGLLAAPTVTVYPPLVAAAVTVPGDVLGAVDGSALDDGLALGTADPDGDIVGAPPPLAPPPDPPGAGAGGAHRAMQVGRCTFPPRSAPG
jgi:hypothetical protein